MSCDKVCFSDFYKITLDELVAGVIDADQIQESFPVYQYHLCETEDQKHSICLTDPEIDLIMKYRYSSENDRQIVRGFLKDK